MLLDTITYFALPVLGFSFLLVFIRLIMGPSIPDRVVALDLIALIIIGFICCYALFADNLVFLDIATVLALIGFLGTAGFSYFLHRRAEK
ncbi:MAG: cation:proton antiporter [Ignavibacteria bacterium]|nr:cation:proton antiporter [Ignavibacteria bacterium]